MVRCCTRTYVLLLCCIFGSHSRSQRSPGAGHSRKHKNCVDGIEVTKFGPFCTAFSLPNIFGRQNCIVTSEKYSLFETKPENSKLEPGLKHQMTTLAKGPSLVSQLIVETIDRIRTSRDFKKKLFSSLERRHQWAISAQR